MNSIKHILLALVLATAGMGVARAAATKCDTKCCASAAACKACCGTADKCAACCAGKGGMKATAGAKAKGAEMADCCKGLKSSAKAGKGAKGAAVMACCKGMKSSGKSAKAGAAKGKTEVMACCAKAK